MRIGQRNTRLVSWRKVTLATSTFALAMTLGGSHVGAATSGANFEVHMTLTGAVKGSLTFKVVELDTPCTGGTGIGSAGDAGVPSPDGEKIKFNGAELQYAINNPSYKGPGTYPTKDFSSGSAAISADKASESDPFGASNGSKSTETMVWQKSGAGSFVFSNWENSESSRSISGKFTWTCKS